MAFSSNLQKAEDEKFAKKQRYSFLIFFLLSRIILERYAQSECLLCTVELSPPPPLPSKWANLSRPPSFSPSLSQTSALWWCTVVCIPLLRLGIIIEWQSAANKGDCAFFSHFFATLQLHWGLAAWCRSLVLIVILQSWSVITSASAITVRQSMARNGALWFGWYALGNLAGHQMWGRHFHLAVSPLFS